MKNDFGVNVAGYINTESGLGEGVRSTLRALKAARIPLVLNNCDFNREHRKLDSSFANFSVENPYPINLIQINGDQISRFVDFFGSDYFKNHYNIGYWAWEMLDFPSEWLAALAQFDEIWTPSNFCVEAIAPVAKVPVVKMPHAIDLPAPQANRKTLGLPADKFIFLFIFDFCSLPERKNPQAVVEAFEKAFGRQNPDVLLIIKSSNGKILPKQLAALEEQTQKFSNVKLINDYLLKDELNALISESDCYVSLHRSEGFGLTLAEAMFYGKPVIATEYSANTDFMNVGNSFPVSYDLRALSEDSGYFKKGSFWAHPKVEHAAELMRFVFENRQKAQKIGAKAAADVRRLLSPPAVGEKMRRRLERIKYLKNDFIQFTDQEKIQIKFDALRFDIEKKNEQVRQLQSKIQLMKDSRFWKIRNQWFKSKRFLGIGDAKSAELD